MLNVMVVLVVQMTKKDLKDFIQFEVEFEQKNKGLGRHHFSDKEWCRLFFDKALDKLVQNDIKLNSSNR